MAIHLYFRPILLLSVLTLFASCSAEKRFHRRLVGTWNIEHYDQDFSNGEHESASNIGTLTFRKNGGGDKNLTVLTRGLKRPDNSDFSWKSTLEAVTIISNGSDLSKTWLVMKNKSSYQQWKSTSASAVQTMTLRKQ